jgi:hypothetical protein
MNGNNISYKNIPLRAETKKELIKLKIATEHKNGKTLTWDEYLLAKCRA